MKIPRIMRSLRLVVVLAVAVVPAAEAATIPITWLELAPTPFSGTPTNGGVYSVPGIGNVTVTYAVPAHWTPSRQQHPGATTNSVTFGSDTYQWTNYEFFGTYFDVGALGPETGTITYTFPTTLGAGCVYVSPIGLGATTSFGGGTSTTNVTQNGAYLGYFIADPANGVPQYNPGVGSFSVQNSTTGAGGVNPHWNSHPALVRIEDAISSLTITQSQLRGDGIGVAVGFSCTGPTPTPTLSATPTASPTPTVTPTVPLDHFLLYRNKKKTDRFGPVVLTDQFREAYYTVREPIQLGLPADKNAEGVFDDVTHLLAYRLSGGKKGAYPLPVGTVPEYVRVTNQCNDVFISVGKPKTLMLPTSKSLVSSPLPPVESNHDVDHFVCYDAKVLKKLPDGTPGSVFPKGMQVEVADQFHATPRRFDLKKITKLCNPVDKSIDLALPPTYQSGPNVGQPKTITPSAIRNPGAHLVCYDAKPAKRLIPQNGCGCDATIDPTCKGAVVGAPPAESAIDGIFVNNQFGPADVAAEPKSLELCIPSEKILVP